MAPTADFERFRSRREATALLAPQNYEPLEAPVSEPLSFGEPHLVDGFDLDNHKHSLEYLQDIHAKIGEGFEVREPKGRFDEKLGMDIAYKWAGVLRAAVDSNERRQSVGDHTAVAMQLGMEYMPRNGYSSSFTLLVTALILEHDRLESLADDTSVFESNDLKRDTKHPREYAARVILNHRDRDNPLLTTINNILRGNFETNDPRRIKMLCEALELAEGWEKLEPTAQALNNQCTTQRIRGDSLDEFIEKSIEKAACHVLTGQLAIDMCKEIAPKWNSWGCEKFECEGWTKEDFDRYVDAKADEIWANKKLPQADILTLNINKKSATDETKSIKASPIARISDWLIKQVDVIDVESDPSPILA